MYEEKNMNVILLSGGSGKRLWPLSNDVRSKQFIKLFKNNDEYESMVQRVYRQITTVDADAKITIATSKSQASAIKNQLGEKASICVEPCRRDTFPAIALAAAYLHDELGVAENEAVVVCPVDPYVDNTYYEAVKTLQELAEQGGANLTLMGIEPTYPSEKYGYIIPESSENVSKVKEFKEKPDVETAKKYLAQSALWNAGIFAFKLSYLLDKAHRMIDFEDYRDLFNKYDTLTKISFDYDTTNDGDFYSNTFNSFNAMLIMAASGIILIIKPFMQIYVGHSFVECWQYVPLLLLGSVFQSYATFFGAIYTSAKKNVSVMVSTLVAAAINLILNAILIPTVGIQGAVIATAIAYFVVFLFRMLDSRKYVNIRINTWKVLLSMMILFGQCILIIVTEGARRYFVSALLFCILICINSNDILKIVKAIKARIL